MAGSMHPELRNVLEALIVSFGTFVIPIGTMVCFIIWDSWFVLVIGAVLWVGNSFYVNKISSRASERPSGFVRDLVFLALFAAAYGLASNLLLR